MHLRERLRYTSGFWKLNNVNPGVIPETMMACILRGPMVCFPEHPQVGGDWPLVLPKLTLVVY